MVLHNTRVIMSKSTCWYPLELSIIRVVLQVILSHLHLQMAEHLLKMKLLQKAKI
jgi:hypothetical protein